MKKRNILILGLLVLAMLTCRLPETDSLVFTNGDESQESALNGTFLGASLIPPIGVKYFVTQSESAFSSKVYWENIKYAKSYNVYKSKTIDGEYKFLKNTSKPSFEQEEVKFSENFTNYCVFYKITSLSAYGQESAMSVPIQISIMHSGSYNGSITDALVSRGSKRNVTISWSPAENAAYYKVYRRISESEDGFRDLIESELIPFSLEQERMEYSDTNSKSGVFYDYLVVPYDSFGFKGKESAPILYGYSLPSVGLIEVSHGTNIESYDENSNKDGSAMTISWSLDEKIVSAKNEYNLGGYCDLLDIILPKPAKFNYYASYSPSNPHFTNLVDTVYLPNFLPRSSDALLAPLQALKEYVPEPADIPADYLEFSADNTFIKENGSIKDYLFFTKVVKIDSSLIDASLQFESSCYKFFNFRVSVKYEVAGYGAFETAQSPMFRGYAVDLQKAPTFNPEEDVIDSVNYSNGSGTVNISINSIAVNGAYDTIRLYKRVGLDIKYVLVGEVDKADFSEGFIDNPSDPYELGERISYRVAYIDLANENIESMMSKAHVLIVGE